jgi:hypothetical protein
VGAPIPGGKPQDAQNLAQRHGRARAPPFDESVVVVDPAGQVRGYGDERGRCLPRLSDNGRGQRHRTIDPQIDRVLRAEFGHFTVPGEVRGWVGHGHRRPDRRQQHPGFHQRGQQLLSVRHVGRYARGDPHGEVSKHDRRRGALHRQPDRAGQVDLDIPYPVILGAGTREYPRAAAWKPERVRYHRSSPEDVNIALGKSCALGDESLVGPTYGAMRLTPPDVRVRAELDRCDPGEVPERGRPGRPPQQISDRGLDQAPEPAVGHRFAGHGAGDLPSQLRRRGCDGCGESWQRPYLAQPCQPLLRPVGGQVGPDGKGQALGVGGGPD